MKTLVLDTNVILRYLTSDLPTQAKKIEAYFQKAASGKIRFRLFHITIVEILFQLQHWFNLEKASAIDKIELLLSPEWMEVESKEAVLSALILYKSMRIDFVDLLTFSLAKLLDLHILSYDKHFDNLKPSLRVNP